MRTTVPIVLARRAGPSAVALRSGSSRVPLRFTRSPSPVPTRTFLSFLKRKPPSEVPASAPPPPVLAQDDLFHPLSHSPFPALVEKADRIKAISFCPTSYDRHGERVRPEFDCPDCGWPTHASEQRWQEGRAEHVEYCGRLREVNEDEHDIRSGRPMKEFDNMPEAQPYEAAVSFSSWDNLFFTRNFPSIDSDRAIRHVSKVLTYPITVASVLHQNGPFTPANGRITREGRRSMAAIHSVLHLPPGSSYESAHVKPQPTFRIFLLGARAESTLPPHLWQQLTYLFPRNNFNIYFIGPEVGLPLFDQSSPRRKKNYAFSEEGGWGHPSYQVSINPQLILTSIKAPYEEIHPQLGPFDPYTDVFFAFSPGLGFPHQGPTGQPANVAPQAEEGQVALDRAEAVPGGGSGATAAGAANAYSPPEVEETKPVDSTSTPSQPLVQAQTSWRKPLQQILQTKCGLFFTAFSPLDLQRDVAALSGTPPPVAAPSGPREFPDYVNLPTRAVPHIDGVTDEFELVLTPGRNPFGSEKWEIAEWDVRVGVKTNWGVWGIRGKRYDVVEGQE